MAHNKMPTSRCYCIYDESKKCPKEKSECSKNIECPRKKNK